MREDNYVSREEILATVPDEATEMEKILLDVLLDVREGLESLPWNRRRMARREVLPPNDKGPKN